MALVKIYQQFRGGFRKGPKTVTCEEEVKRIKEYDFELLSSYHGGQLYTRGISGINKKSHPVNCHRHDVLIEAIKVAQDLMPEADEIIIVTKIGG